MPRLLRPTVLLAACVAAAAAQAQPQRGPDIRTDDVTRFYALYDASGGRPTVEQLARYLDEGTPSLQGFAKARRVTAERIAERMQTDPAIYAKAKDCVAVLPAVKRRLLPVFAALADLYPSVRFPPVAIVVGRGKPVGIADRDGVTLGLEALCAADFMNPDLEERFVRVIAHEYGHVQQTLATDFEPGDPNATVLRFALAEGTAELIAELTSGGVGNGKHAQWTRGKEAQIESDFVAAMHGTDISKWFYDYRPGSDAPYDLGYWVGYRIVKAYYLKSKDRKAALKDIIEMDDPKAFLQRSGWTPGMTLPETALGH